MFEQAPDCSLGAFVTVIVTCTSPEVKLVLEVTLNFPEASVLPVKESDPIV
jgi:hypothetical protein